MNKDEYLMVNGTLDGWDANNRPYWKKDDAIRIYGEDKWKSWQKKNYEHYLKWKEKNPEKVSEHNKHNNKNEFIEKHGQDAYDEKLKKVREKRSVNKDEINKRNREKRKENPEKYYMPYSRLSKKGRAVQLINRYKKYDRDNGYETNITTDQLVKLWDDGCCYCGETDWHKLGADRIDNNKGHTIDNVVCACKKCNIERRNFPFPLFHLYKKYQHLTDGEWKIVCDKIEQSIDQLLMENAA